MTLLTTFISAASASGPDTTPPTFISGPEASSPTTDGATVSATINELGNIYWVVVPQADLTPTSAQVKAGLDAGGLSALDSGSALNTTSIVDQASGLTPGSYKFCVVAEDIVPNLQASPATANFITKSLTARSRFFCTYKCTETASKRPTEY